MELRGRSSFEPLDFLPLRSRQLTSQNDVVGQEVEGLRADHAQEGRRGLQVDPERFAADPRQEAVGFRRREFGRGSPDRLAQADRPDQGQEADQARDEQGSGGRPDGVPVRRDLRRHGGGQGRKIGLRCGTEEESGEN